MNSNQDLINTQLDSQLQEINQSVWDLVNQYQGDSHHLLSVLRNLESLHRQICNDLFLPSLPNTRKALYTLLREMEEQGGWPYIQKMRLQELLVNLYSLELTITGEENLTDTENH